MPTKNFNPDGIDYLMFTPGPVNVPDFILKEMGKGNDTHRSTPYREMHKMLREELQKLLMTKNDILFFASSGTGIMEACVRNLIKDDETAVFFTCGAFGERWAELAPANGKKADVVKIEWGQAVTPELVKETLDKKKYPVVFITFNETSTGVMNPIDKIAPIVKATGALLCVDCVSCMAGVEIKVDEWGIDVALASVQKCFAVPPGLALCSISTAALEKTKTVPNRGSYLDFIEIQSKGAKSNEHPVTPPTPQMRALLAAVKKINNEVGAAKYWADQAERTKKIHDWAKANGFEMYSPEGNHSKTVATIKNTIKMDVGKFVDGLFKRGFKIVNGYGKTKDLAFRIAAMGWITKQETENMLNAASEALKEAKTA